MVVPDADGIAMVHYGVQCNPMEVNGNQWALKFAEFIQVFTKTKLTKGDKQIWQKK